MQASSSQLEVPAWYASEVIALFSLYPSATMSATTVLSWWRHHAGIPKPALLAAFKRAPTTSAQWCPTAEVVKEIAQSVAKTLVGPKADYSLPQLEEGGPEIDPALTARFAELRRMYHGRELLAQLAKAIAEHLEGKGAREP